MNSLDRLEDLRRLRLSMRKLCDRLDLVFTNEEILMWDRLETHLAGEALDHEQATRRMWAVEQAVAGGASAGPPGEIRRHADTILAYINGDTE